MPSNLGIATVSRLSLYLIPIMWTNATPFPSHEVSEDFVIVAKSATPWGVTFGNGQSPTSLSQVSWATGRHRIEQSVTFCRGRTAGFGPQFFGKAADVENKRLDWKSQISEAEEYANIKSALGDSLG